MAIKDLVRPELPPPTPAAERPPNITCEKYTRGEDGKRCIHFQQGGTCALPDEFVCTEWQKHNGPNKRTLPVVAPAPVVEVTPAPKPVARDLFGNPLLASAGLDRLAHAAEVLVIQGTSYRAQGRQRLEAEVGLQATPLTQPDGLPGADAASVGVG